MDTLNREKQFSDANRYYRIWGNHDRIWYKQKKVDKYLKDYIGNTKVVESMLLRICQQNNHLGNIFLVHGHQGDFASDKIRAIARVVVQGQRLRQMKTCKPLSRLSRDCKKKTKLETLYYNWANDKNSRNKEKTS